MKEKTKQEFSEIPKIIKKGKSSYISYSQYMGNYYNTNSI